METAKKIVIDDGTREIPIYNQFDEEICRIRIRPTDISIMDRFDALKNDLGDTLAPLESIGINADGTAAETDGWQTLKAVEAEDTAGSAEMISRLQCRGWAAICHADAAKLYGLKVLQNQIEDNKHNFTRFLVVCNTRKADFMRSLEQSDKASLVFSLPHEEGSLSKVLTILSFYNINLTKIQSLPVIGHEWEYMFYVDVTYQSLTRYRQAIDAIMPLTKELKILGEYEEC